MVAIRKRIKKALLVGINRYQIPGADLRGCVNDIDRVESVITEFYGFHQSEISRLVDLAATTDHMKQAWEDLVADAVPGDVLLFHFSGHGSNVPDHNGDEPDGRDEILCPTDLNWYAPFLDDWIGDRIKSLPRNVNLTMVFDCCHSGTLNRTLLPPDSKEPKERFLPCPLDLMEAESGRKVSTNVKSIRARTRAVKFGKQSQDVMAYDTPEIFMSGCRDDQTSADAYIQGDFHGALTFHMIDAIQAAKGQITYRQLHAQTTQAIKTSDFSQRPQLSGKDSNLDRFFLQSFKD